MRKIIYLLFLFFLPLNVLALTVDYDIENAFIDAYIEENGDLKVRELLVLDGSFNGYIRDINYRNSRLVKNPTINFNQDAIYNGKGIENVVLKAKKFSKSEKITFASMNDDFETLTKAYYDADAVNKNYVESSNQNGKSYKMYYRSNDEIVGFLLEYTLTDMAVKHQDVGELYWTPIGNAFDDDIEHVQIRVHLPKEDPSNLFRVWAHGDLRGEVYPYDNSYVLSTIDELDANTSVDIRLTFDTNLLTFVTSEKETKEIALPKILEVEEKRADDANKKRQKAKIITTTLTIGCVLYFIYLIIWWIYVYFKFDREYKSTFTNEYNREFIDRYNVEVVDVLMNNNVTPNAMSASILNLVYKKNIRVEEIESPKKKEKNYSFHLENKENINETEKVLLDFLFERVGKDNVFTTLDLKNYASSTRTYQTFYNSYRNWTQCVQKDAERENFYEKNGLPVITSIFTLLIAIFIAFASVYFNTGLLLPWLVFLSSVLFFFYCAFIKKRTKQGNEDYVRWKAMKKFLEDFGHFELKELPEIALWERYLVYATVFGIADKVEKSMNVKIHEMELTGVYYTPSWIDIHIANEINHSILNSVTANRSTYSSQVASSHSSSGSGFGGGFSSGGGFGGGGGGGRGF